MGKSGAKDGFGRATGTRCREDPVRRAALYATAKIAFGSAGGVGLALALASCGGEAASSADLAPPTSGEADVGGASSSFGGSSSSGAGSNVQGGTFGAGGSPSTNGASGAGAVCVGPYNLEEPPLPPGPTAAEFACCVDLVRTNETNLPASEPVADCCRAILTAIQLDNSRAVTLPYQPCCRLPDVLQRPQILQLCAPWGPPVPPAIDWQAA